MLKLGKKATRIMAAMLAYMLITILLSVFSFTASASEGVEGFVTRMYRIVLDREPDELGFEDWTTQLKNGEKSAADIVLGFFYSQEYLEKGKSNGEVVTDFYAAMLDREPDEGGFTDWTKRLDIGMTKTAIASGFVNSQEFTNLCNQYGISNGTVNLTDARDFNYERTYFVYRLYKNCLGRDPEISGLEDWCRRLSDGATGSDVAYGFIFSGEYWDKHTTNEEFVEMMYNTILGRESEEQGKNSWSGLLNYTNTREHVFNGFLFSNEFAGQCQTADISVGNQIGEPDTDALWQYNIRVLELVNIERAKEGLPNLVTREDLWRNVACVRANELPSYFSHTRPDGSSCWTAYYQAGISKGGRGENISAGYSSPEDTMEGWMNSSGHRANILRSWYHYLATGHCYDSDEYDYWCQNFLE